MAFDKEKLYKKALEVIEKEKCQFIEDVVTFMPCSKDTFYKYLPIGSDELDEVKEKIAENRIKIKHTLRKKWLDSDNASLQMGLYKLIGTEEERRALSQSHHDITTKDKELPKPALIDYDSLPTEVLEAIINAKKEDAEYSN